MAIVEAPVLALYDFRSKQEFIYRTNRMKEITGASELIAEMYGLFIADLGESIVSNWRDDIQAPYEIPQGKTGIVVYEGGGNLCILYRDRDSFVNANRRFSRVVLERAYSLCMISACVESCGDFEKDRKAVYAALDRKKRIGRSDIPCNVLPYTQVDRTSFQPIASKENNKELSRESLMKVREHERKCANDRQWEMQGKFIDDLGTEKGVDSLIAVIYSDGNSIGELLKKRGSSISAMREFSQEVHHVLVEETESAIKEALERLRPHFGDDRDKADRVANYRIVIDHGDEITLICNAHAAPFAIDAYFEALATSGYRACMGVAFCHSHDPFSEVYKIAEELCESGKKRNRKTLAKLVDADANQANSNYVDFHFCRSGITGSLSQIRDAQEAVLTARPYRFDDEYKRFISAGQILGRGKLSRADLKELNRAILKGDCWYELELERLKAKDCETVALVEALFNEDLYTLKQVLFDITSFWDVFDLKFANLDSAEAVDNA